MEDAQPLELPDVLFEVFSNGQRHAIGTRGDPDDMEPDEPLRLMVPLHVLQMLVRDTHNRRWEREELEEQGDEDVYDEVEAEYELEQDDEEYGSFEEEDDMMIVERAAMDDSSNEEPMQDADDVEMQDADGSDVP